MFTTDTGRAIVPVRVFSQETLTDAQGRPVIPCVLEAGVDFAADGRAILPVAEFETDAAPDGTPCVPIAYFDTGTTYAADGRACRPVALYDYASGEPDGGSAGGDEHFENVVLLLGNTEFMEDESSYARTVSRPGGVGADVTTARHGLFSYLLEGNGTYLECADAVELEVESGPYTIEGSFRLRSMGSGTIVLAAKGQEITNRRSWRLEIASDTLKFSVTTAGTTPYARIVQSAALGLVLNQWYDIAVDSDGTTIRLYLDGAMIASGAHVPASNSIGALRVGHMNGASTSLSLDGWLDEFRFTVGVARYASDSGYSVATAPFPRTA